MAEANENNPDVFKDPLWIDIKDIVHQKQEGTFFSLAAYQIVLHTESEDIELKDHITPLELMVYRDYEENLGDYIELSFKIPSGMFMKRVYPYLDNLEVTVVKQPTVGRGDRITNRYKAVFLKDKNKSNFFSRPTSEEDLDLMSFYTVRLQLIDRTLEPLRIFLVQGSFNKALVDSSASEGYTATEIIKSVMSKAAQMIEVDGEPSIDAVDIEPPDNDSSDFIVVLRSGTRLIDVPIYLQDHDGVYLGGIGCYLQRYKNKKTLFVYSLYDSSKFSDQREKLTFYAPKSGGFSMSTKTYRVDDDSIKVVVDPISDVHDLKESLIMSSGSGIRLAASEPVLKKPVILDGTSVISDVEHLVSEFVLKERRDGLNYAPVKPVMQKNVFKEVSMLKNKYGHRLILTWRQSHADLIFPGMAFKLITLSKEEQVIEFTGVILKIEVQNTTPDKESFTPNVETEMAQTAFIHVFVDDSQSIESLSLPEGGDS